MHSSDGSSDVRTLVAAGATAVGPVEVDTNAECDGKEHGIHSAENQTLLEGIMSVSYLDTVSPATLRPGLIQTIWSEIGFGARRAPRRRSSPGEYVIWLHEPASRDASLVGGKSAGLAQLGAYGQVPPGFSLTAAAADLAVCAQRSVGDEPTGAPVLPRELYHQVAGAYKQLGEMLGVEAPPVAVRSSAVDEDGAGDSFAGQHDTYLNVVGIEAVTEAIRRSWLSATTQRAAEYRRGRCLASHSPRVAVLVQALVKADVSVVMFTADPVTGSRDEVVINATWGLGESLVGGTVTPDTYSIRKPDLVERSRQIADKRRMTVAVPGGSREVNVPACLRARPALTEAQAQGMARLGLALEVLHGGPVDIEAALSDDKLYLLQCRPITTLTAIPLATLRGSA